jgi:hypothetical protein
VNESNQLEYGGYSNPRPLSHLAIGAFAIGLCSGPLGIGSALIIFGHGPDTTELQIGSAIVAGCLFLSLTFSIFIFIRLNSPDGPRGRKLALAGIIATMSWIVAIVVFALYLLYAIDHAAFL